MRPTGENPVGEALECVERALASGDGDPFVHATAGHVYILAGLHDLADLHSEKAVSLNPNDVFSLLMRGYVLAYLGEPAAGVEQLNRALQFDPHGPDAFNELLAEASYLLRDYETAIEIYTRWQNPPLHTYVPLAVNYAQLGRLKEAQDALAKFKARNLDNVDFDSYSSDHARMCKREEDREHRLDGYRKIGAAV